MTLDYSKYGKVAVGMNDYIHTKTMADLLDNFESTAVIPATNHLFEVDERCLKLDNTKSELFHNITAQIIFLENWGIPGLLTGV